MLLINYICKKKLMKDIIEEIWSNRELLKDSKYIKIINDVINNIIKVLSKVKNLSEKR